MKREDWDARYEAAELLWSAGPNRFLVAEVADLAPGRGLDVACGEGRNALWLAERGWDVIGVDFSPVAIAKAGKIAAKRGLQVAWQVADVREHRPQPRSQDLVVVMYLHLPWPDMTAALRAAVEGVAPGGVFLLVGHDRSNLEAGHGGPKDPAVLYTPEQIAGELSDLVIEKAELVRRRVEPRGDRVTHRHPGPSGAAGGDSNAPVFAIDNLVRARRAS